MQAHMNFVLPSPVKCAVPGPGLHIFQFTASHNILQCESVKSVCGQWLDNRHKKSPGSRGFS